jgi:hypothetical protein
MVPRMRENTWRLGRPPKYDFRSIARHAEQAFMADSRKHALSIMRAAHQFAKRHGRRFRTRSEGDVGVYFVTVKRIK